MLWYIVAGVLAVLLLVLFIPLSLTVKLNENGVLRLKVRVLGIPVYRSPKPQRRIKLSDYSPRAIEKRQKKRQKKLQKQQRKKKKPKSSDEGQKKRRTPSELGDQLSYITELTKTIFKRTLKHAHVDVKSLTITVGTPDAAKTAVLYGTVSAALACLSEALHTFTHLRIHSPARYGVAADFTAERCRADIHIRFRMRLWQLIDVALRAFGRVIRRAAQNETKKSK